MRDFEYKAYVSEEEESGFVQSIKNLNSSSLPEGEVLIKVKYAALNYKDALSAFGHKGITRKYPHTPGVDVSGVVVSDTSGSFKEDSQVICTSFDLGMNTSGGFGEYIRVPVHWVIPLPKGMTLLDSMILGTAAYTAGLALYKMEQNGQNPKMGKILVTGASGGVGTMAIVLLHRLGYQTIASTGKKDMHDYLRSIGANEIISREDVIDVTGKVLLSKRWAGAMDNVGGETLSTILKSCARNGSVASIGLVSSPFFESSVYPFILNGINLLGVDSAETPLALRKEIWRRLSEEWKLEDLGNLCTIISLEELGFHLEKIKSGNSVGRVVLKHY